MHAKELTNKDAWDSFVLSCSDKTFLHSWEWGQVQKETGEDVQYVGLFDGDAQKAAALFIIVRARRGVFLLIPHGPLYAEGVDPKEVLTEIKRYGTELGKKVGAVALRIAPLIIDTPEMRSLFTSLDFRPAPLHIHAELTWILAIDKSEDEILSGMRKTTRHAVRKGAEAGVTVDIGTSMEYVDRFWPLYEATKNRHGFTPFGKDFLLSQAKEFLSTNHGYMVIAKHEGKDVAGAFMVHFGDTVFYHHGASVKLPSSVPAAQVLHWESIKEARKRGATKYNFWGIAPADQPNHPFAGITTFKKGFGGEAFDYLHAQDLPLSIGYWKLWLTDTWRRWRRGF